MIFNNEHELVNQYICNEKNKLNRIIIPELQTNFGRPDIVLIDYNQKLLTKRRQINSHEEFPRKYSYVLSYLAGKGWLTKSKITHYFSFSEKETNHIIERLHNLLLLDIQGTLIKLKPTKEIMVIKRIHTVEAKLTNWKYVIEQAERHFWFSKESSILLPSLSSYIIENAKQRCSESGIGLYIVNQDTNIEVMKPSLKGLINTPLLWELNEKLIRGDL